MYSTIRIPLRSGHIEGCWYGKRDERPILALHGWQDNAGSFALLAPLLSQHVAVLAIDLPGHGRSSHHPPGIIYHTAQYVPVIKEIMSYFQWSRVSLMGHSMGAGISYLFMALYPHLVDVMVSIDIMHSRYHTPDIQLQIVRYTVEKFVAETELMLHSRQNNIEAPSYTFERLEELLHEGSEYSVDLDKTKYILERNTKVAMDGKYGFTRDGGIKFMREFYAEPGLCLEMARKMTHIKWLVLKAGDSYHIDEDHRVTKDIVELQTENNPNFSFHVVPHTKHHCHLNNAESVAAYILPFLRQHREAEPLADTEAAIGVASKL